MNNVEGGGKHTYIDTVRQPLETGHPGGSMGKEREHDDLSSIYPTQRMEGENQS